MDRYVAPERNPGRAAFVRSVAVAVWRFLRKGFAASVGWEDDYERLAPEEQKQVAQQIQEWEKDPGSAPRVD